MRSSQSSSSVVCHIISDKHSNPLSPWPANLHQVMLSYIDLRDSFCSGGICDSELSNIEPKAGRVVGNKENKTRLASQKSTEVFKLTSLCEMKNSKRR